MAKSLGGSSEGSCPTLYDTYGRGRRKESLHVINDDTGIYYCGFVQGGARLDTRNLESFMQDSTPCKRCIGKLRDRGLLNED